MTLVAGSGGVSTTENTVGGCKQKELQKTKHECLELLNDKLWAVHVEIHRFRRNKCFPYTINIVKVSVELK